MDMSHEVCYEAIKTQDARFDGIFYTAVKTTGIYCRPVCKVPVPKAENCIFYESAEISEANGYRPCLRCRPELAPGYGEFEQSNALVASILRYFEEENYKPGLIKEAADYLGISSRHLNRVFNEALGVNARSFLMTKRLLRAKMLLSETSLNVSDITYIAGFGSVSRLNAAIKKHYKLTPTHIRKNKNKLKEDSITVKLAYRPPYDWQLMLNFYKMRSLPGVEWVDAYGVYRRSLRIEHEGDIFAGWIEVNPKPDHNYVLTRVSTSLESVLLKVIKKIRLAFDLDVAPDLLNNKLRRGIRLPGCFDAFEMATRAVLGQQITVKAARTLASRMVNLLGKPIATPWAEVGFHFPSAKEIIELSSPITDVLGPLGIIKNRSNLIYTIALAIDTGDIELKHGGNANKAKAKLIALKGIGPWTAEYLTMRGLSWPDAFPVSDIGVKHALTPLLMDEEGCLVMDNKKGLSKYMLNKEYEKHALEFAEAFRPWRSYLTISLWYSLSD